MHRNGFLAAGVVATRAAVELIGGGGFAHLFQDGVNLALAWHGAVEPDVLVLFCDVYLSHIKIDSARIFMHSYGIFYG